MRISEEHCRAIGQAIMDILDDDIDYRGEHMGNSAEHWYDKAKAYKGELAKCFDVLIRKGVQPNGSESVSELIDGFLPDVGE